MLGEEPLHGLFVGQGSGGVLGPTGEPVAGLAGLAACRSAVALAGGSRVVGRQSARSGRARCRSCPRPPGRARPPAGRRRARPEPAASRSGASRSWRHPNEPGRNPVASPRPRRRRAAPRRRRRNAAAPWRARYRPGRPAGRSSCSCTLPTARRSPSLELAACLRRRARARHRREPGQSRKPRATRGEGPCRPPELRAGVSWGHHTAAAPRGALATGRVVELGTAQGLASDARLAPPGVSC